MPCRGDRRGLRECRVDVRRIEEARCARPTVRCASREPVTLAACDQGQLAWGFHLQKATPVSGGRRRFRLQASLSGLGSEDRQKRSLILNPPKASSRQCPLPSRASSIDLEHSESFVKPDHATSVLASAGLACSPRGPVRSLSLFYTQHGRASQVLPEMGSGSVAHYPEMDISASAARAPGDHGWRSGSRERRATTTRPHRCRRREPPRR